MVANKHGNYDTLSKACALTAAAALSLGISAVSGQPAAAKTTTKKVVTEVKTITVGSDTVSVKTQLVSFSTMLAAGDAAGLAAMWTPDGEYIDEDGVTLKGRSAIQDRFTKVFGEDGKPQVKLVAEDIKFVAPTVVLVEGRVEHTGDAAALTESRYSAVMVHTESGWQFSRVAERNVGATSSYDYLRQMEWLVGEWTAQNNGVTVHMRAEWLPNKNFILCRYETKKASGPNIVDIQVIGWDPIQEKPRSWSFDNSGGYGQGFWLKAGTQWICDSQGVENDGSVTHSRNILNITSPTAFTWSSVHRSVNGMAVGDAPALEVQKVSQ